MPIYQMRNGDFNDLRQPDQHSYEHVLSEPLGGFGVWNGSFEQGPDGQYPGMENWTIGNLGAGCTIARTSADQFDGQYCVRATSTLGNAPGFLDCNRWFPVNENVDYYADCATRGSAAGTTLMFRAYCYNAAKVFIAAVSIVSGAVGVNWVWRQNVLGPAGTAWPAGTYWVRLGFNFNWAGVGWAEVDCVVFQIVA